MTAPLVYASRAALERARTLMPGQCLERRVEGAILAGRKRKRAPDGINVRLDNPDARFVLLDGTTGAIVVRQPSPLTGKKSWLVTSVFPVGRKWKSAQSRRAA
jgi:hypothetical protein